MANLVLVEDGTGELVDVNVYCSDYCAQTDPLYAGWYGCADVEFDTACASCGNFIDGETENEY